MITLINKVFNDRQYTLVDKYDDIIENEIIYHFCSERDDLFCLKVKEEYEIITDEKIVNLVKEAYELFPLEIIFNREKQNSSILLLTKILQGIKGARQLSSEEREKLYDVQIDALKKIGVNIDFSKLKDRLTKEGHIYMCDQLSNRDAREGFFHPATNSIFLFETDSFGDRRILHETIHKATGPRQCTILPSFLVEGGAESIVKKVYGSNNISQIRSLKTKGDNSRSVKYNFNINTSYQNEVCLLSQIEYAVGYSADKDVLSGTREILDDFSRQYGRDVLIYVSHVGNQITRGKWKGSYEKMIKAQNLILERVFNRDFPKELTLENAQEYLSRLQAMELHRARIEGDEYYKEFYEEKYRTIKQMLLERGYELSEIEESIPKYEPAEFYPTLQEKMIREESTQYLAQKFTRPDSIVSKCRKSKVSSIEKEDFRWYALKKDDSFFEFFTYNGMIWNGRTVKASEHQITVGVGAYEHTSDVKREEDDNIVYFDSQNNTLRLAQNGQNYEFEELVVPQKMIDYVNSKLRCIEELHENAIKQQSTEIQKTKRNLFQRIQDWLSMEKNNNRTQEDLQKDANDQR